MNSDRICHFQVQSFKLYLQAKSEIFDCIAFNCDAAGITFIGGYMAMGV